MAKGKAGTGESIESNHGAETTSQNDKKEEIGGSTAKRLIQQERIITEIAQYVNDMKSLALRSKNEYITGNNPMGFAYAQCIIDIAIDIDSILKGAHIPTLKELNERLQRYILKERVDIR